MIALIGAMVVILAFGNAYITTVVFLIIISFILAQSWDWIGGEMGYVNLGHAVFYGIGAYAFALSLVAWNSTVIALCISQSIRSLREA